jgi:hypothetical protein
MSGTSSRMAMLFAASRTVPATFGCFFWYVLRNRWLHEIRRL